MRRALAVALVATAALLAGSASHATPLPNTRGCKIFPADNPWNTPVNTLPLAKDSAAMINAIGRGASLHPDFGSGTWDGGPIGIPFDVVSNATPTYRVRFQYADERTRSVSDPAPRPIEGGPHASGDRHALLVNKSTCRLYELYNLHHTSSGWKAGSGATGASPPTSSGRPAGRRPTPPGCRSSPASRAGTKCQRV